MPKKTTSYWRYGVTWEAAHTNAHGQTIWTRQLTHVFTRQQRVADAELLQEAARDIDNERLATFFRVLSVQRVRIEEIDEGVLQAASEFNLDDARATPDTTEHDAPRLCSFCCTGHGYECECV